MGQLVVTRPMKAYIWCGEDRKILPEFRHNSVPNDVYVYIPEETHFGIQLEWDTERKGLCATLDGVLFEIWVDERLLAIVGIGKQIPKTASHEYCVDGMVSIEDNLLRPLALRRLDMVYNRTGDEVYFSDAERFGWGTIFIKVFAVYKSPFPAELDCWMQDSRPLFTAPVYVSPGAILDRSISHCIRLGPPEAPQIPADRSMWTSEECVLNGSFLFRYRSRENLMALRIIPNPQEVCHGGLLNNANPEHLNQYELMQLVRWHQSYGNMLHMPVDEPAVNRSGE